ncbi:MAG TPA: tetratricopeptide repeat protein [bacterium]|nr:tetratricopeptide repeat protein [bacterium]
MAIPMPSPRGKAARRSRSVPLALSYALLVLLSLGVTLPRARGAEPSQATLLRELHDGDAAARRAALLGLKASGDFSAVPQVAVALRDDDAGVRQLAEEALWAIWSRSGKPEVDDEFNAGTLLLARGLTEAAVGVFTRVIERAPDFAEAYNKRATAEYQLGRYEDSLKDIAAVLKRNPYHFGALSGAGLCLIELGRFPEAIGYFDRALNINPNLDGIAELKQAVEKRLRKPLI